MFFDYAIMNVIWNGLVVVSCMILTVFCDLFMNSIQTDNNLITSIPSEIGELTALDTLSFRELICVVWLFNLKCNLEWSCYWLNGTHCVSLLTINFHRLDDNDITSIPTEISNISFLSDLSFCEYIDVFCDAKRNII